MAKKATKKKVEETPVNTVVSKKKGWFEDYSQKLNDKK